MPSKLPWHRFKTIAQKAGGTEPLGAVVDEARTTGRTAPSIADVPKEQLPHLDRYAHGANFRKGLPALVREAPGPLGLPLGAGLAAGGAAAYEAAKFIPPPVWNAVVQKLGRPDYLRDQTTSAPDAGNVMGFLRGYLDEPGLRR